MKPDDFRVTEYLRTYCVEHNWPSTLPDVFLDDFKRNWRDRLDDGRPPKWKNAELALRTWIRDSSPGHRFYRVQEWEAKLAAAKSLESPPRKRIIPAYDPRGTQPSAKHLHSMYALARSRLAKIRVKLI